MMDSTASNRQSLQQVFVACTLVVLLYVWLVYVFGTIGSGELVRLRRDAQEAAAGAVAWDAVRTEEAKKEMLEAELTAVKEERSKLEALGESLCRRQVSGSEAIDGFRGTLVIFERLGMIVTEDADHKANGGQGMAASLEACLKQLESTIDKVAQRRAPAGGPLPPIDVEGVPSELIAAQGERRSRNQNTAPKLRKLSVFGKYEDMTLALALVANFGVNAIPMSVTMERLPSTDQYQKWTLVLRIAPQSRAIRWRSPSRFDPPETAALPSLDGDLLRTPATFAPAAPFDPEALDAELKRRTRESLWADAFGPPTARSSQIADGSKPKAATVPAAATTGGSNIAGPDAITPVVSIAKPAPSSTAAPTAASPAVASQSSSTPSHKLAQEASESLLKILSLQSAVEAVARDASITEMEPEALPDGGPACDAKVFGETDLAGDAAADPEAVGVTRDIEPAPTALDRASITDPAEVEGSAPRESAEPLDLDHELATALDSLVNFDR